MSRFANIPIGGFQKISEMMLTVYQLHQVYLEFTNQLFLFNNHIVSLVK